MHDLAKVVAKEAAKLLALADQKDPLSRDTIEALEILCRCAKALKTDAPPGDDEPPGTPETPTATLLGMVDGPQKQ